MKNTYAAASKRALARARQKRGQLKQLIWLVLGGFVLVLLVAFTLYQPGGQDVQPPRIGQELGNFTLADLSGQNVQLADYRGKVVLINAWATWCPPCRAEMPDLNRYYQQHQAEGFVILAINAGETTEEAAAFAQEYSLAFPILMDPYTRLLNDLNVRSFPTSVVIDRDGIVRDIHIGIMQPDQIEATISPLLAMK